MGNWDNRRERKARLLLQPALETQMGGRWADVGCGDGVFTRLLLDWLAPESAIVAIDRDGGALRRLARQLTGAQRRVVQTVEADFTQPLPFTAAEAFDGMLLANSLHFVQDKPAVLAHLITWLRPGASVIIIEYNATRGNWAVPHPFSDETCLQFMTAAGLSAAHIVTREPSSFLGEIYTALAIRR